MKKINRNPKIIIFTLNLILFIVLIFTVILFIYPEIMSIESEKKELSQLKKDYLNDKTKGFKYTDFKKVRVVPISTYQKKILSKITKEFYEKNFINSTKDFQTYEDFLENLDKEIKGKLQKDYKIKKKQIYGVMPIYSDYSDNLTEGVLTNFQFVNFIENLLYKNDLTTTSPIGIKSIKKVEEYSPTKTKTDLSADIYVISLPLKIEGKKKNIIRFLKNIYKMGRIHEGKTNDGERELIFDNSNYFVELESVKMDEYIDSSPSVDAEDKKKNLIEILTKTNQKNESFEMSINLLFYVQGLANYKIKEEISDVFGKIPTGENSESKKEINYNSIKLRVKKIRNKYSSNKLVIKKLNKISSFLESLKAEVSGINKDVLQGKDMLKLYEQAQKYKTVFMLISKELDTLEKNN